MTAVVLLAGDGTSTRVVFHALAERFGEPAVVLEPRVSGHVLARRRLKRLPATTVAGQVLFSATAVPWLARRSRSRSAEIARTHRLDTSPLPESVVTRVPSVNTPEARDALVRLDPAVVVVNGTRIIGSATLSCVAAPFVNMHAGITPQYRGVHGGYWALAEGRPELVGTTVHIVDTGIDTGSVVAQATFPVTPADSFATYPLLHTAAGLDLLLTAVGDVLAGRPLQPRAPLSTEAPSVLRYHPTLWGYLATRRRRGVR